jgi:hypothetical protein
MIIILMVPSLCVRTPEIIQIGVSYLQAEVGADYENHLASSFFAEYIQLGVVVVLQLC